MGGNPMLSLVVIWFLCVCRYQQHLSLKTSSHLPQVVSFLPIISLLHCLNFYISYMPLRTMSFKLGGGKYCMLKFKTFIKIDKIWVFTRDSREWKKRIISYVFSLFLRIHLKFYWTYTHICILMRIVDIKLKDDENFI